MYLSLKYYVFLNVSIRQSAGLRICLPASVVLHPILDIEDQGLVQARLGRLCESKSAFMEFFAIILAEHGLEQQCGPISGFSCPLTRQRWIAG